VEDDGPDEAEGQLGISVHDVFCSDVDQLDLEMKEIDIGIIRIFPLVVAETN
jgi:hypothetical protein